MSTLILRPLPGTFVDPVRKRVVQRLDTNFELELGRTQYGITDMRISRVHIRLTGGPDIAPTVTAVGQKACALISANSGERKILRRGEHAVLSAGDELHLVGEEIYREDSTCLGNPCAYFVGLSSTALALTPLDGRKRIEIEEEATIGRFALRSADGLKDSYLWGIRDPRVSRHHARIVKQGTGETYTVQALASPLHIVAADGSRSIVRKGGAALLPPGAQLNLVHDKKHAAEGKSLPWAGNSCAWRVELRVKPFLLLRPIGAKSGETQPRKDVELRGAGATLKLGRNVDGVADPRISSEHVSLSIDAAGEQAFVSALGLNPMELLSTGSDAPVVLRKPDSAQLNDGDKLRLLWGSVKAFGVSAPFAGNCCEYQVEFHPWAYYPQASPESAAAFNVPAAEPSDEVEAAHAAAELAEADGFMQVLLLLARYGDTTVQRNVVTVLRNFSCEPGLRPRLSGVSWRAEIESRPA